MTSLRKEKVKCAVCGKRSEIMALASTNQFGTPDLDLRPPEMARSTISLWVHRCPDCGYCASRLDEGEANLREFLRGRGYQAQLTDSQAPRLAASFLCRSMIDEANGNLAEATWALIHAAWACDDADNEVAARACRGKAADMLVRAEAQGQPICQLPEEGWAVLVDLLRRAGKMPEAREAAESNRAAVAAGQVLQVLDFQRELILRQDTRCHTLEEALPPAR
jgi:hypothetical protein